MCFEERSHDRTQERLGTHPLIFRALLAGLGGLALCSCLQSGAVQATPPASTRDTRQMATEIRTVLAADVPSGTLTRFLLADGSPLVVGRDSTGAFFAVRLFLHQTAVPAAPRHGLTQCPFAPFPPRPYPRSSRACVPTKRCGPRDFCS